MGYKQPPVEHQIKPGEVRNPNGRPKGVSITALVREALEKVPEGQKEKAKDLLVKRIMHKAISEGDTKLIEKVWEYMDGKPIDRKDYTTKGDKIDKVSVEIVNGNSQPPGN